jgi:hypothetical protein
MTELPAPVRDFLLRVTIERRAPAYLFISNADRVTARGGWLESYSLDELRDDVGVSEQVPFITGLLPLDEERIFLPAVKTDGRLYADVHLFRGDGGTWMLLLDASADAIERQQMQQTNHDLVLRVKELERGRSQVPPPPAAPPSSAEVADERSPRSQEHASPRRTLFGFLQRDSRK